MRARNTHASAAAMEMLKEKLDHEWACDWGSRGVPFRDCLGQSSGACTRSLRSHECLDFVSWCRQHDC